MPEVQKAVEESFENRPGGMPTLAVLKTETAKLGLPDSDAEYLYDVWLRDDFRTKRGTRIKDWQAAIRLWYRNDYFPSQRKALRALTASQEEEAAQLAKIRRFKDGQNPA